jgi:hypothetical protein
MSRFPSLANPTAESAHELDFHDTASFRPDLAVSSFDGRFLASAFARERGRTSPREAVSALARQPLGNSSL